MSYQLYFSPQAVNDWETLKRQSHPSLLIRCERILEQLRNNPFCPYPPYKKLVSELSGLYARRINLHHRLVYKVTEETKSVEIVSMWTHYGD